MTAVRNGYLLPCLVATLGGLLFGFDHIVIGGAKPFYEPYLGLTGAENAWASGFAMAAPIAAGIAKPIVPMPPDERKCRG